VRGVCGYLLLNEIGPLFKSGGCFFAGLRVFRTGRHVPPSLAMPGTVDHRRVNRAAYRLLVSGWHGRNDENAARLGLLHKRSQPLLFLLPVRFS
jgi:hypothetical protein